MQNVQLAAWELGVGVQWSTGPITMQKETYELLGADQAREYIIGFFYMGYPREIPSPRRKPLGDVMRWSA
jgi:nitroreductase